MQYVQVQLVRIPSTHKLPTPVITVSSEAEPLLVNPTDNGHKLCSARVSYNLYCGMYPFFYQTLHHYTFNVKIMSII